MMAKPIAGKPGYLPLISLVYLALPVFVFFLTWLRPGLNLFFPVLLVLAMCFFSRDVAPVKSQKISRPAIIAAFVFALYMVLLSGQGQLTFQRPDYVKHNLVLHDLAVRSWPVIYTGGHYLCYYIAWYLPAALAGKVFGISFLPWAMALWSFIGLSLAFLWLVKIGGSSKFYILFIVFALFGSFDLPLMIWNYAESGNLGWLIWGTEPSVPCCGPISVNYDSPATNFYWAPQHSISAWLFSPLVLHLYRKKLHKWIFFLLMLSLLWSPLVSIGLLLFTLAIAFTKPFRIKPYLSLWPMLLSVLLSVPLLAYFAGHLPMEHKGFIFSKIKDFSQLGYFVLFWLVEFILLFIFIRFFIKRYGWYKQYTRLLYISITVLMVLPIYWMGRYNDFPMRASMPFTWLLALLAGMMVRKIIDQGRWNLPAILFFFFLTVCAIAPSREHIRGWVTGQDKRMLLIGEMPENTTLTMVEYYHNRYDSGTIGIKNQYFGKRHTMVFSFFYDH